MMRPPSDMPPRVPRRRRRGPRADGRGRTLLIFVVVAVFVLAVSLRGIASFYTDYLWFDSLNLSGVWRGVLGAKLALALIFTVIFFLIMWINLLVADRIAPPFRMGAGSEDDLVERYHELIGDRGGVIRSVVAIVLALLEGSSVSSQWRDWILFTNRVDFGKKDATFHTDIGFYVFQLPFLKFLVGWVFGALVIVLIATIAAHYLNGGIRMQVPGDRVSPQVKAHVSVLMGLLLLVKAGGYLLQRYELVFSTRGTVDGATYTDVNVQMKAISLLIIISLTAFVLLLVNIRRRGWVLPIIAVGLWAFVAILAGQAVPSLVQRFRVQPDEPAKEAPYIQHNIDATREALGLDKVGREDFAADGKLTGADLARNADVVRNIRLWDPVVARKSLDLSQGSALRDYFTINDVDVDRYRLNGRVTQVNVAARELNASGIPQKTWVAEHLNYTHGFGAVMSPANATTATGEPELVLDGLPVRTSDGAPTLDQPRVYIGEGQSDYVIVRTKAAEFDFEGSNDEAKTPPYTGADGVKLNSFARRAAFALRFGTPNPLISNNISSDSRILIQRDVVGRVKAVAPFLSWDSDPYPVLSDKGMTWVIDGFTTTSRYPNAQRVDTRDVPDGADLRGSYNYVRNSVKATIDAYDGTVTLYVVDDTDPLIKAYQRAFPELFTDGSRVPPELRAHFRYPSDLFRVQTTMWGRYHIDDPTSFYNRSDEWNVAPDPEIKVSAVGATTGTATTVSTSSNVSNQPSSGRVDPYYLQLRLPGETTDSFTLLRPFVASSRSNQTRTLTGFLSAQSDPGKYGKLQSFRMPPSNPPPGPQDIAQAIDADTAISERITLLCQQQSRCTATNLLVIPIEQSLLYVRPLYVESDSGQDKQAPPKLGGVIVAFETGGATKVKFAPTLNEAITALFGSSPGTLESPSAGDEPAGGGTNPPTTPETPSNLSGAEQQLINDISTAFDEANALLKKGDLAGYADKIAEADKLVGQLKALAATSGNGGSGGGSGEGAGGSSTTTTKPESGSTTVPRSGATTTTTPGAISTTKPSA